MIGFIDIIKTLPNVSDGAFCGLLLKLFSQKKTLRCLIGLLLKYGPNTSRVCVEAMLSMECFTFVIY